MSRDVQQHTFAGGHLRIMFTLTEVASLNDIQPTYRILKPWWDVFMDYLGLVMLMLAIFAMTMQITKDQVACLPCPEETGGVSETEANLYSTQKGSSATPTGAPVTPTIPSGTTAQSNKAVTGILMTHGTGTAEQKTDLQPEPKGVKTNLDFQQYVFINQMCYHDALPWSSKYFPYLTLIHTIILMVSSNFWFKYPKTSSKIDHFVSILGRCFESPWTTKALSETACEDSEENKQRLTGSSSGPKQVSLEGKDESPDTNPSTPMLGIKVSVDKHIAEVPSSMTILDKKDGEQAKALFEKVRKFRAHVEDKYSFEKVREESSFSDIPDVKNDFAFLLHMVDQYDQLHSKRFGVFLSEVSENKLREISLNHEWTFEKLKQHVTRNAHDQQELHLFMLSGLPNAVFDLTDLEVLKLELIPEVRFSAKVSQMTSMQELHLCHCPAKVEQTGFAFLRDHLRCLHVKFTDVAEIPPWVYLLRSLRELYLMGNLNSENNKMIGLESMRDLRHLKTLCLKSNLTKMPTNITELSPHLLRLVVHNDGTKLLVLNSLKKMTSLVELELHNCELERIPHAIFSLTNLQELDLKSNNIRTIEEIISFQHLKRLTCLKLWHNKIITIPASIGHVKSLESLHLSHNKLESLPSALFTLPKLRHLDVAHNSITVLPPDVGLLNNLQHLAINSNKLEALPKPLFRCTKLKVLCLGQNALTSLPETVGQLVQLTQLELRGNCLDRLPIQLGSCRLLRKNGLIVEDHLFDTLPWNSGISVAYADISDDLSEKEVIIHLPLKHPRVPQHFIEAMKRISATPDMASQTQPQKGEDASVDKWKSSFQPIDKQNEKSEDKSPGSETRTELYDPNDPLSSDSEAEMSQLPPAVQNSSQRCKRLSPDRDARRWESSTAAAASRPLERRTVPQTSRPTDSQDLNPGHVLDRPGYEFPTGHLEARIHSPDRLSHGSSSQAIPESFRGLRTNGGERKPLPDYPREEMAAPLRVSPPRLKREHQQLGYVERGLDQEAPPPKLTRTKGENTKLNNCAKCLGGPSSAFQSQLLSELQFPSFMPSPMTPTLGSFRLASSH
ncbi:hypothetical protein CCH79_00017041 [Gambusia affinis]|uniref:LRRC8 pannexin-like TM region domain-containing protein n=1 Tax=Gambusia affinis TaxID=33528 RepID=A0A315URE8_GAMAF|nr:hypothetical protein CCH79_00017041 [Gambusia affinis]